VTSTAPASRLGGRSLVIENQRAGAPGAPCWISRRSAGSTIRGFASIARPRTRSDQQISKPNTITGTFSARTPPARPPAARDGRRYRDRHGQHRGGHDRGRRNVISGNTVEAFSSRGVGTGSSTKRSRGTHRRGRDRCGRSRQYESGHRIFGTTAATNTIAVPPRARATWSRAMARGSRSWRLPAERWCREQGRHQRRRATRASRTGDGRGPARIGRPYGRRHVGNAGNVIASTRVSV